MPRVTFIDRNTRLRRELEAAEGWSLLDVAREYDLDIEGACDGNMACATCHVIVHDPWFDRLPEPSEEEEDMLDLAYGLTGTSRLGCQVRMSADLDGLEVSLPGTAENI